MKIAKSEMRNKKSKKTVKKISSTRKILRFLVILPPLILVTLIIHLLSIIAATSDVASLSLQQTLSPSTKQPTGQQEANLPKVIEVKAPLPVQLKPICDVWEFEGESYCLDGNQYENFTVLRTHLGSLLSATFKTLAHTTVVSAYSYAVCIKNNDGNPPVNIICPSGWSDEGIENSKKDFEEINGLVDNITKTNDEFQSIMRETLISSENSQSTIPDLKRYGEESDYQRVEYISEKDISDFLKK